MEFVGLLENIIREAMRESECVALFIVCLLLVFVMHTANTQRLEKIKRELEEVKQDNHHK